MSNTPCFPAMGKNRTDAFLGRGRVKNGRTGKSRTDWVKPGPPTSLLRIRKNQNPSKNLESKKIYSEFFRILLSKNL